MRRPARCTCVRRRPASVHVLGLHMAALALALGNGRIAFLGADTPVLEIARASAQHAAEAIVLSASDCAPLPELQRDMAQLRELVPSNVPIVAGGRGFTRAELASLPGSS